jgi:hypothetical protein
MASGHGYRTQRLLRPTLQVKILLANPEPSTHDPNRTRLLTAHFEAQGCEPVHMPRLDRCDLLNSD